MMMVLQKQLSALRYNRGRGLGKNVLVIERSELWCKYFNEKLHTFGFCMTVFKNVLLIRIKLRSNLG